MKRNKYNKLSTSGGGLEPIVEDLGYQEMEIVITPPATNNHLQLPLYVK